MRANTVHQGLMCVSRWADHCATCFQTHAASQPVKACEYLCFSIRLVSISKANVCRNFEHFILMESVLLGEKYGFYLEPLFLAQALGSLS